jgi:hypothetical protein
MAASFALLGEMKPYYAAVIEAWRNGAPRPYTLLQGAVARLARALRARDFLQVRMRAVDFDAVWRDALLFVDALLVSLIGALDATARLVHSVYSLDVPTNVRPSWQNRTWRRALVSEVPAFEPLVSGLITDVFQIVGALRNSVHEAPLSEELHGWNEGPVWTSFGEGVIALPNDKAGTSVLDAARRDGGESLWGVVDRNDLGAVFVNPGLLAERAVRQIATCVRNALSLVDWQKLGELDAASHRAVDVGRWVPSTASQRDAMLLSGLGEPGLWIDRVTQ